MSLAQGYDKVLLSGVLPTLSDVLLPSSSPYKKMLIAEKKDMGRMTTRSVIQNDCKTEREPQNIAVLKWMS